MAELVFIIKSLWLCFVVYFLVRDSITSYITMRAFFMTGELKEDVKPIPSRVAMRVVNVVLALTIIFS